MVFLLNSHFGHIRLRNCFIEKCMWIGFFNELGLFVFDIVFIEYLDLSDHTLGDTYASSVCLLDNRTAG